MYRFIVLFIFSFIPALAISQGQEIDLPEYGINFVIPEGWSAQVQGEYMLMGHQTIPGLIIIFENTAQNTAELKMSAEEGLYDEGVSLAPEASFTIAGNQVNGYYSGQFQGTPVRAYAVGLVSTVGSGFTAIVLTETSLFSEAHEDEMNKLVASVRFKEVAGRYTTEQWKGWLIGSQLRYLHSSGGSDYGGGYSGSSQDIRINLCSNGSFLYYSNSSSSFDSGGGFGYTHGNDNSSGTYEVYGKAGRTFLKLLFNSGEVSEYQVTSNDEDHTLLNDTRYFLVDLEGCN